MRFLDKVLQVLNYLHIACLPTINYRPSYFMCFVAQTCSMSISTLTPKHARKIIVSRHFHYPFIYKIKNRQTKHCFKNSKIEQVQEKRGKLGHFKHILVYIFLKMTFTMQYMSKYKCFTKIVKH